MDKDEPSEEMRSVEGVVQPRSILVNRSAQRVRLQDEYGVNLLAVGRADARITERLRDVTLRAGDVLVLRAGEKSLPTAMKTLGATAAGGTDGGGSAARASGFLPAIILSVAMVMVGLKLARGGDGFLRRSGRGGGDRRRLSMRGGLRVAGRPRSWC